MPKVNFRFVLQRSSVLLQDLWNKPGKWIRERKLVWAEEQIRKFTRMLKEIYHEAGYRDYLAFSYAFKKNFGTSPRRTIFDT